MLINNENLISIGLYGDGSREAPLRAEYIYCSRANECSLYKNGCCFCVTVPFGKRCPRCPIGKVITENGGTKRAKKYHELRNRVRSHEKHRVLQHPNYTYITRIGDDALLSIPYVKIEQLL